MVTIVTPTSAKRDDLLFSRCIPSVRAQSVPTEHVIVADRSDALRERIATEAPDVRFVELNDLWKTPEAMKSQGAIPWYIGTLIASGEVIGFLGDDDELLPDHVAKHVAALEGGDAHFSISKVAFHVDGSHVMDVGDGSLRLGQLDADGIMGRAENFRYANWRVSADDWAPDFDLVQRWALCGLRGVFIDQVTAVHHDGWLKAHMEGTLQAQRAEIERKLR